MFPLRSRANQYDEGSSAGAELIQVDSDSASWTAANCRSGATFCHTSAICSISSGRPRETLTPFDTIRRGHSRLDRPAILF